MTIKTNSDTVDKIKAIAADTGASFGTTVTAVLAAAVSTRRRGAAASSYNEGATSASICITMPPHIEAKLLQMCKQNRATPSAFLYGAAMSFK